MSVVLQPGALVIKDPSSLEPYGLDWTDWLAEIGANELITASTWAITGKDTNLTVDDESIVTGQKQTQAVFEGGTVGVRYTVVNTIETTSGYQDQRSFKVLIQQQ